MKTIKRYPIPAGFARNEVLVVNSRFIASVKPVFTVDQARSFIKAMRNEFSDATHNVPAFLVGYGASVTAHCSDDGEPSGTAGRPALTVLQGSGLGDIAVVITRYFGGTKLGTGGLVRAYTKAVQEVLSLVPRAEKRPTHTVMFEVAYSMFENTKIMLKNHQGVILDEDFGANVLFTVQFPVECLDGFQMDLSELSKGKLQAEIIETNPDTIMPIEKN